MTVYHINKGIGRASSGIEYAQKYRYDLVKNFPYKQYFVYCDLIASNLITYTDKIGIDKDFVLSAYQFMARQKNHRSTYRVEAFVKTLPKAAVEIERTDRFVLLEKGKCQYKIWLIPELGTIDRVDYIVNHRLLEVSYFNDRLTHVDYYSASQVIARYFYDDHGKLSLRQFYRKKEITLTFIDDEVLQGRHAFYRAFFQRLHFSAQDLIIVDRNQDLGDALFPQKNDAKLVVVVHAEHYSKAVQVEDWVLWNNFYEYPFTNYRFVDAFIVSTAQQAELLHTQFALLGNTQSQIITIPVGSISEISDGANVEKNKYSFLTASRLAWEKHIDVLIKAVVRAKKELPELEFHIYGAGKFEKDLRTLIDQLKAQTFIFMEGHKNLKKEYAKYGGYLSASGSEGFGLTILEAVGACLPIIGLKVNYGNTTFVKSGVNGILVEKKDEKTQIKEIAQAIIYLTKNLDYEQAIAYSRKKALDYTDSVVREKWNELYQILIGEEK